MIRLAINGFGRIGRLSLRALIEYNIKDMDIVAIHSHGTPKQLAHLLQYDSSHGRMIQKVGYGDNWISIGARRIDILAEYKINQLPWSSYEVDVLLECTGQFNTHDECQNHIDAGAKRVLVSAPCKQADATIVFGVNDAILCTKHRIVSNASCTTNCVAPLCKVLHDSLGIKCANMTTIHAVTGDQPTVDSRHKNSLRRSRAAFQSMIPTSTGAGKVIGEIIPDLKSLIDGTAIRVPTLNVSVVDLVIQLKHNASVAKINHLMREASTNKLSGVLDYVDEELVSCDFIHNPASAIFDATGTQRFGEDILRVMAWYDNEWAFAVRMLDVARKLARL